MDETEKTDAVKTEDGVDILNSFVGKVGEGNKTLLEIVKDELGDNNNITLTVKNQKVLPEAPKAMPKMASPKRAHVFHDAKGFGAYITKYKTEDTVVLVNVDQQTAYAVINEKADKGFEIITMKPVMHPLFRPWVEMFNRNNIIIKSFADFLRANRRVITVPVGIELVQMLTQIKVSRKITLHRGTGTHSLNGITCEMDIVGSKPEKKELALPDSMKIKVPMYLSTDPVELEIDLNIDADDNNIYVTCTCPDVMPRRIDAFDNMLKEIEAIEKVTVALGTPNHEVWARLASNNR